MSDRVCKINACSRTREADPTKRDRLTRLEVGVHQPHPVEERQRRRSLLHQARGVRLRVRSPVGEVVEHLPPGDQVHDEVEISLLVEVFLQAADVGVGPGLADAEEGVDLPLEVVVVGVLLGDHLKGALLARRAVGAHVHGCARKQQCKIKTIPVCVISLTNHPLS